MQYQEPYSHFEERRTYPRVVTKSPVTVCHNGVALNAEIYDISADGVQIRCDRETFQRIHPTGMFIRKNNAPVVDIDFEITVSNAHSKISVKCLMYYFVLIPGAGERDVAFGLRFIMPEDNVIHSINAYIENAMTPEGILDFVTTSTPQAASRKPAEFLPEPHRFGEQLMAHLDGRRLEGQGEKNHMPGQEIILQQLVQTIENLEKRLALLENAMNTLKK